MCIIAVVDETGRPSAGRGVGFDLLDDHETVDVIFSAWQWPRLESSIRQTAKIATTFVSLRIMSAFSSRVPPRCGTWRRSTSIAPTAS